MSDDFIAKTLQLAKDGKLPIVRSQSSRETKWTYHMVIENEGRIVVGLGDENFGDQFGFGFEIKPEEKEQYL